MPSSSVSTWLQLAASGDSLAAQRLWERYIHRLVRLAATELGKSSKRLADEEDLALVVFHEFLRKAREGIYPRLHGRDDFWQIIVQITHRRAIDQSRRARAYDRHVVKNLTATSSNENDSKEWGPCVSPEVSPEDAVAFADQMVHLFSRLSSEELRRVVQLRLAGMTDPEIAAELCCSLRTVERRFRQIRLEWGDIGMADE